MEQYKVILVDDEVEVIDVMKKKIRWNDLSIFREVKISTPVTTRECTDTTGKGYTTNYAGCDGIHIPSLSVHSILR